ncbi:peroxiredoxin [Luteolibacter yonseiensis]|uniref:thioredoxin-dependent peroxiredoxin n=1 Tax=Luteolibacter yonseiensis TaxID=1144680 RepID=A0A934R589_9BACT|nr:peroxiredoxin [Luteolibacter yonseiensis]MBK1816238.1 peroxiredoxin [Luteolibacter yonseiensis]
MTSQPRTGDPAPNFTAQVIGGGYATPATVSLADFKGKTIILYFYPKDDTPGCTTQACSLRDGWGEISGKARVLGVSIDPIRKHAKFISKYELPFPLLSDEEHRIADSYGVWVEKTLYGRTYMGTERTTFVIGPDSRIKAVLPKVKPDEHLGKLLSLL